MPAGWGANAPPVVVFTAQLEVAQYNGDLSASDEEDNKHQAQEAKQVVELVQPHGSEDEEELNEHCAEGQDASNQDAEQGIHVPGLQQSRPSISQSHAGSQIVPWTPFSKSSIPDDRTELAIPG